MCTDYESYVGYPLDPPLRSRFQCRAVVDLSIQQMVYIPYCLTWNQSHCSLISDQLSLLLFLKYKQQSTLTVEG
jgi:hypothetical protein